MRDKNGNSAYASYSTFYIGGSTTDYTLHVSGYSGTAGDSLTTIHGGVLYHNLMKFTTKDNDNDLYSSSNCAVSFTSAWWYRDCYYSNLNGYYGVEDSRGIVWYSWKGWGYSLPYVEMKIRHT